MATTLTLGSSTYGPNDYLVNDNSVATDTIVVNPAWGTTLTNQFYNSANSATLFTDPANGVVSQVKINLAAGNDTLLVNAQLSGVDATADTIRMGDGDDSLTINQGVNKYGFIMGTGNDTLVINEATASSAYDVRNSGINLSNGADSLVVNADLFNVNIKLADAELDGVDTIVLKGTSDKGVNITQFNIGNAGFNDILIIGGQSFSSAVYSGPTGIFNSGANLTGTGAAITAVNTWLNLGNEITLI
jgi:autotransporter family porin